MALHEEAVGVSVDHFEAILKANVEGLDHGVTCLPIYLLEDVDVGEPVGVAAAVPVDNDQHEFESALTALAYPPLPAPEGHLVSKVFEVEATSQELFCFI